MSARSGLVGKKLPAPFGGNFYMDRKHTKNARILPISLGGPMGPIHPVWGHVLVSFWTNAERLKVVDACQQHVHIF